MLFELIPGKLIGLFNPTEEMMTLGVRALQIIAICFPFAALGIVSSTLFQALAKGTYSLVLSLLRQLVVLVPAAWILGRVTGNVASVWWAFPIAELFSLAVSILFFVMLYRNKIRKM